MIIVADSGSTKTDWAILTPDHIPVYFTTQGFNPYFNQDITWMASLRDYFNKRDTGKVAGIFYYGAGCNHTKSRERIITAMKEIFGTVPVEVQDDLLGAARALWQEESGIAVILGTGTNIGVYDGSEIAARNFTMGYLLGDHGSGAVLGKRLLQHYYDHILPEDIVLSLDKKYDLDQNVIKDRIYRMPGPNYFLAGFVPFLVEKSAHPVIRQLILDEFMKLFRYQIMPLVKARPLHIKFTGSVAYFFRDLILEAATPFDLTVEHIEQYPIRLLADFHLKDLTTTSS